MCCALVVSILHNCVSCMRNIRIIYDAHFSAFTFTNVLSALALHSYLNETYHSYAQGIFVDEYRRVKLLY